MSITEVVAVSPDGQRKKMVESAFLKVWQHRGWRLASEVDAEAKVEEAPADDEITVSGTDAGGAPVDETIGTGTLTAAPRLRGAHTGE